MKPALRPTAVPWLFDGVPSYLSTPSSDSRSSPSRRRRLVNQRQQLQQSEWLDAQDLRASIVQHHTSASIFVNIKLYTDHVMLYNRVHAEYIDRYVRVASTITKLPDMRNHVFIGGERLPDNGHSHIQVLH